MNYHFIYKVTNIVNGKYYIGKHSTRKIDDGYLGSGVLIRRAVKRYGKHNFVREILCMCEDVSNISALEESFVSPVVDDPLCYNIAYNGGTGGSRPEDWTPERRAASSRSLKGIGLGRKRPKEDIDKIVASRLSNKKPSPLKGKPIPQERRDKIRSSHLAAGHKRPDLSERNKKGMSEKSRKKLSLSLKGVSAGEKNPMYGKTHSEETRKLISEKNKMNPNHRSPRSEETKIKMSEARKKYWQRKREENMIYESGVFCNGE